MTIGWRRWLPFQGWRIVAQIEAADEIPERLPWRGAVIVGSQGAPKWIAFDCACGKGHRIMLNLDRKRRPSWQIKSSKWNRLTISPSIDFSDQERRCHYFVRDGRVQWTGE